jgi:cell division protein FtsQ
MKSGMKKVLDILVWVILCGGLAVSFGFSGSRSEEIECRSVSINIDRGLDHSFVEEKDILGVIRDKMGTLVGKQVSDINIALLEKWIRNNPFVDNAEVYSSVDGDVYIDVNQRSPILRIIGSRESYYVDEKGIFMPLAEKYTARVLIASGYIYEPYSYGDARLLPGKDNPVDTLLGYRVQAYNYSLKDTLYTLARFIYDNEFWRAQVQQIYVNENREIELIPAIGNHRIILGDISDKEEKFERLMNFYKKGLSRTGWSLYSTVNLKYKNQVVCTKKQ